MGIERALAYSNDMKSASRTSIFLSVLLLVILALVTPGFAAQTSQDAKPDVKVDPKTIPVIDGGAGSCSAEFTVNDSAGAPVYDAKIRVHIDYRWAGFHKLDLEVGTNTDGKARFVGIPAKTKRGLTYYATKGDQEGSAFINPASSCKAQTTITLAKKTDQN
jgi:hypothetical protein